MSDTDKKSIKLLVTGGAGFIGSNLVRRLLGLDYFVRVVDNLSTGREENIKDFLNSKQFEFIKGDLTNLDICRQVVKDIDYIFHLAAIPSVPRSINNPIATNDSNVSATLNLLVAARDAGNIKKFIYSSSSSIYGDSSNLPSQESDPVNPISPYSLSKYTGERYCQIFSKIYGLPTVCLRYFNVFGPKQDPVSQYGAVIPKFIFSMLQNKIPIIYGDGEQTRDFTYVDNIIEANILAAFSDISGEVVNIACSQGISINEIAKLINGFLGTNINPNYGPPRLGEIRHSLADISKAEKLLKYQPKVYFKEGLQKAVEWFRGSGILEIAERFSSIRFANEKDAEQISKIYREKIKTGFVSSLGLSFLTRLYETMIKSTHGICLVIELDNKVVGFIAGSFNIRKLYWDFSKKNFLKILPILASKILNPKKIKKVFETLFYPNKRKELSGAELFVVELQEGVEEGELRDLLFKNFVSEIKKRNIQSFKTVVHESFKETIDFYQRMGLRFHESIEIHKGERSEIYLYEIK